MISFLLIIVAPVLQIILSVLFLKGKFKLPIVVIAFFTFLLGIGLAILSSEIINDSIMQEMPNKKCLDCGLVGISFTIIGFFITIISVPTIGLICAAILRCSKSPTSNH
jgi:hypothetical protein